MSASQHMRRLGQPIAYFPELARMLGGVNASIFFSQLFYWLPKSSHPDGIYKTAAEIESETGLTVQEQRTARKKLVDLGVLIETNRRIEHRLYFKLDLERFDALSLQHSGSAESTFAKCSSNIPEMQNQHSGSAESTFDEMQNQHSYKEQENTKRLQQETTAGEFGARAAHATPPADAPDDESAPPCPAKAEPENGSDGGKREGQEAEPKVKRMSALAAFTAFLVERGVSQQVARDWWAYRNGKPMTDTAWARHCLQADKAGITPQEAAAYAASREWRAFYAAGYQRDESNGDFGGRNGTYQHSNRKLTPHEQFLEAERQWVQEGAAIGTNPIMYGGCDDEWQDGQFREV